MACEDYMRIDKWLWAARFYKSRNSAAVAVNGGKVHVNRQRVRPSKQIKVGDKLKVTRGQLQAEIKITALCEKRGPSSDAQKLYEESHESIEKRKFKNEQRKLMNARMPSSFQKPDKRQRRQLRKVSGKY